MPNYVFPSDIPPRLHFCRNPVFAPSRRDSLLRELQFTSCWRCHTINFGTFQKKENKICIRLSLRQQIYVPKVCSNTALNVKIIVNQNTKRNLFQRFKNSGIQVFGYSGIQVIRYSGIQIFRYSGIQVFGYSGIQVFRYSGIQVFGYSCIQVFRHSGIQVFKYSGIQVFRYPGIEAMSLSYSQCTQSDCFTIFICSRTSVGASVAE